MSLKKYDRVFTQFKGENVPEDFSFPSVELEDIDRAVFDLFDKLVETQATRAENVQKQLKFIPLAHAIKYA